MADDASGAAQQQVAIRHGVRVQTIRKILGDTGVSVRDHRAALTRYDILTIGMAHAQGTSRSRTRPSLTPRSCAI